MTVFTLYGCPSCGWRWWKTDRPDDGGADVDPQALHDRQRPHCPRDNGIIQMTAEP